MSYLTQGLITSLLLPFIHLLLPQLGFANPAGMDRLGDERLASQCGEKIEKFFPYITIPVQELALEHVRFLQKHQQVLIPLKAAHGDVTAIRWHPRDATEGMDFIRLLQSGKVGAVKVLPFLHHPGDMYMTETGLKEKLKDCQKEKVQEVFGKCAECEVMEWVNLKP